MNKNSVRERRLARAWSQEQLAELASLNVRTIQRIENGGQASLDTLGAIAAAFGVTVAELTQEATPPGQDDALDKRVEAARARLARESAFWRQLVTWFVVCSGLTLINLFTSPGHYWFMWPTLIWGGLIAVRGMKLFVLGDWLARRQQQRLQQLLRK